MKNKCYLVGAGDFNKESFTPNKEDYIIAVDGGFQYLKNIGSRIDMVVGDFDSVEEFPEHKNIKKHSAVKDDTDMMIGIQEALKLGYQTIYLFGATGGRMDHTLGNLQLLHYLKKQKANGIIFDQQYLYMVLSNEEIKLDSTMKGYLSLFALDAKAEGVTIQGLKYEISDVTITNDIPLGISNEFIEKDARVSVSNGSLLLIVENNKCSVRGIRFQ